MTQYAKIRIKVPKGTNVAELKAELESRGYGVDITGVFLQMFPEMPVPDSFKLKSRKEELMEKINSTVSPNMVIMPEHMKEMMHELPLDVRKVIDKMFDKLQTKEGLKEVLSQSKEITQADTKLICNKCDSKNIMWMTDDEEVMFHCRDCGDKGWMKEEEYRQAIKHHPECIFWRKEDEIRKRNQVDDKGSYKRKHG